MLNFARFFLKGIKNTLRLQNGVNFSYKGPWIPVVTSTVIDEWYIGELCAAEYTVVADLDTVNKEIIKCIVTATKDTARLTVYGRTSTNDNLINLEAVVNASKVQVIASAAAGTDDPSSMSVGSKVIFSANYYYTLNEIV